MALTPTEESKTRALIAQNAALLSLASNEAAIISELGAGDVTLADLPAAASIAGSDLLLVRQGATERSALASQLTAPTATETVTGIVELATVAEAKAGTDTTRAVTSAGVQAAKISQGAPVTIASAATVDIGSVNSVAVEITGNTAISSFGTNYNGPRFIRFTGTGVLTHSASLSLPGTSSFGRGIGDTCIAYPNSALNGWNVYHYQRAANLPAIAGPLASSGITGAAASGANSDITSLTGLTAGGLPDNSVLTANIAALQVTGSKIAAATITPDKLNGAQSGSAPIFAARAWCVFNGTLTGTNAPTAGGNVSSVTRNSAGKYTINFATAMPDANYCVVTTSTASSSGPTLLSSSAFISGSTYTAPTTSGFVLGTQSPSASGVADPSYPICVAIFR